LGSLEIGVDDGEDWNFREGVGVVGVLGTD